MEVLKSGLTLLSNPIGTLICGSGSAKLPNPMDTLIYGGGISQTGFGEFAGPDFPFQQKRQQVHWARGGFDTVVKPSSRRLDLQQRFRKSTSPVDLSVRLPKRSARRRHWGQGDALCRRADVHPRYACDKQKRTEYGVVSMPSGIFPGLGFDR